MEVFEVSRNSAKPSGPEKSSSKNRSLKIPKLEKKGKFIEKTSSKLTGSLKQLNEINRSKQLCAKTTILGSRELTKKLRNGNEAFYVVAHRTKQLVTFRSMMIKLSTRNKKIL